MNSEGKYIVNIDEKININDLKSNQRVVVKSSNYLLYKILNSLIDPIVSLMKIEKSPNCNYNMLGGI